MPKRFTPKDFVALALSLRRTVVNHRVPPKLRASLIEDIVFRFAVFVDEKTGGSHHETISGLLAEHVKDLGALPTPEDYLVAELRITFLKGRGVELNVLRSSLLKPALLRLNLEVALGVRDIDEIKARIDTEARYAGLVKKKGGVKRLEFTAALAGAHPARQAVRLQGSRYGNFDQSLSGLVACIEAVAAQWMPETA
jgi:hypothetical protein